MNELLSWKPGGKGFDDSIDATEILLQNVLREQIIANRNRSILKPLGKAIEYLNGSPNKSGQKAPFPGLPFSQ